MIDFSGLEKSRLDSLSSLYKFHTSVDILRLDLMHSVISGNKWFKLKEYIKEAIGRGKSNIITFGGAYSNHLVATAAYASSAGLKSTGLVRGEKPPLLSATLQDAMSFGMDLYFLSREAYKNKELPQKVAEQFSGSDNYFINEGGYGPQGAMGARAILTQFPTQSYTHILAAVGTGTTLAGLISGSLKEQNIIGISVLKNHRLLEDEINDLIQTENQRPFKLIHDYHFGGYAKYTPELIAYMNEWYQNTGIPSDFVYTAKLFYAVNDMINKNYFPQGSSLLVVHSGGLQGNRSLPKGTLIF